MSEQSQKLKMIGVDIAKDKLDIAFDNQKLITIANTELAFKKLLKNQSDLGKICIVMEASGGYEQAFSNYFSKADSELAIVISS